MSTPQGKLPKPKGKTTPPFDSDYYQKQADYAEEGFQNRHAFTNAHDQLPELDQPINEPENAANPDYIKAKARYDFQQSQRTASRRKRSTRYPRP